jgi:hypothetical protein
MPPAAAGSPPHDEPVAVPSTAHATPVPPPAPAVNVAEEATFIQLPEADSWSIPVRCYKCGQTHVEPVRNFMVGNVIFCPECNKSMVVRDNVNFRLRSLLKDSYDKWNKDQREFKDRRERELAAFTENRTKEAQAFELHQEHELSRIRQQLDALGSDYDAPGKPVKKGTRFGWG